MPLSPSLAAPAAVTLGYLLVYYLTILNVLRVKSAIAAELNARGESFDRYATPDPRMRAADRIQLNTLEHMPPFLTLLWLDAGFAGAAHATALGGVYLATRCLYPFMVGTTLGGSAPKGIGRVTTIGYVTLALLAGDVVRALV